MPSRTGALRVSIFGLRGADTPKTVKLDRMPRLGATPEQAAFAMYRQVCLTCHGVAGRGEVYSPIAGFTQLGDPEVLKTFLQNPPAPMPRLYPGLLDDDDISLIADYLKANLGK
jgi:mono/diheme cytochrome c family protein